MKEERAEADLQQSDPPAVDLRSGETTRQGETKTTASAAFCLLPGLQVRLRWTFCLFLSLALGCNQPGAPAKTLTLGTTTTLRDCGLLDVLLPMFERQSGIEVKPIVQGSGHTLELARRGDADVLLTHSPQAEEKLVAEGFGISRQPVMHSEFVLLGPTGDPAGVEQSSSIADAFAAIAGRQATFVSRGDESGTHFKELDIWRLAAIAPEGRWYLQAGSGMAETLRIADDRQAYVLSERATYLTERKRSSLAILLEGDKLLVNPYSVIVVNPARHPHVHVEAANSFARFLRSAETRQAISTFGLDRFGEPLFVAD
ncbi:MAG: substrate-binding domain-containing protein [Pirellulales bacterium]